MVNNKVMKKKVIAFDLDGTLSVSKSQASDRMIGLLNDLLAKYKVCIISGGKLTQFELQVLAGLKSVGDNLQNLHLMPTCGTRYYTYQPDDKRWHQVYAEDFTKDQKDKIFEALDKGLDETKLRPGPGKHWGELIEDRGSQITLSVLGQEAPVEAKEAWDPEDEKKYRLRDAIAVRIPEYEVRAGGLTSIDVTKLGIDKAYGMDKLMEVLGLKKEDILFFGDKMHEGGNDYPVKAMGIDSIAVRDWEETAAAIETILKVT